MNIKWCSNVVLNRCLNPVLNSFRKSEVVLADKDRPYTVYTYWICVGRIESGPGPTDGHVHIICKNWKMDYCTMLLLCSPWNDNASMLICKCTCIKNLTEIWKALKCTFETLPNFSCSSHLLSRCSRCQTSVSVHECQPSLILHWKTHLLKIGEKLRMNPAECSISNF